MKGINYSQLLRWILWLIAIHSICYGLALIIFPASFFSFFGFDLPEKFFADQGGVFHLIISAAYIMAARDLQHSRKLIFLSYFTKFSATVFLISYFLFAGRLWIILFSGILDFLMGLAILLAYLGYKKQTA
jgi:hypothetical protein